MNEIDGSKKIGFTTDQIDFMNNHGINCNDLYEVAEKVDRLMRREGWEKGYIFNDVGNMCEDILDTLADMDD